MKMIIFIMLALSTKFAFAADATDLPASCKDTVYAKMSEQGIDPEDWGSIVSIRNVNKVLKNEDGTVKTGVAFYKLTTAHNDSYLVLVDYNQQPVICSLAQ